MKTLPQGFWQEWSLQPGILIPLLVLAVLYGAGARRRRGVSPIQITCFSGGWLLLVLSLLSPLHAAAEELFSAHMAQHELLMLGAAPLLVLSRPFAPMLHGMPFEWRRPLGRVARIHLVRASWCGITHPFAAWSIHAFALWVWHIPTLFDATLRSEWVHAAQHASFFLSALLFWWALFPSRPRAAYGAGVMYVFTTAMHTGILGALLTLSSRPWYPAYAQTTAAWGLTPLQDQQLGGLIMWVPAGLVYLAVGLSLLAAWLHQSEQPVPARRYA